MFTSCIIHKIYHDLNKCLFFSEYLFVWVVLVLSCGLDFS